MSAGTRWEVPLPLDFFESKTQTHPIREDWATADFLVRLAKEAK